jgi:hypothetical protein
MVSIAELHFELTALTGRGSPSVESSGDIVTRVKNRACDKPRALRNGSSPDVGAATRSRIGSVAQQTADW